MNNQTPTAQSGPSAQPKLTMKLAELPEWIERTIQTIEDPIFNYSPAEIANALRNMLKTLAETPQDPPAGARDAVTDEMVERAVNAHNWHKVNKYGRKCLSDDDYAEPDAMRAALEAALTGKADGTHGHAAASDELAAKEVLVPCDCGCGRQCCAMCGNDLGFIAEATQPAATGAGNVVLDGEEEESHHGE